MERIDLFDRYIFGRLSKGEKESLELRLNENTEFASDYNAYLLCVNGIRREAEQDNIEFSHAMKSMSRHELLDIIGKKTVPMSREQLIEQLRGRLASSTEDRNELSGMAALSNDSSEDDEIEIPEAKTDSATEKNKQENFKIGTFRILTFVFIAIILIILLISLFL